MQEASKVASKIAIAQGKHELARRLRTAREHAGLSQTKAARLLFMHRPTISEIESARRKVFAEELAEFARIYNVSVQWLLGTEENNKETDDRLRLAALDLTKLKLEDLDKMLRVMRNLLHQLKRKS